MGDEKENNNKIGRNNSVLDTQAGDMDRVGRRSKWQRKKTEIMGWRVIIIVRKESVIMIIRREGAGKGRHVLAQDVRAPREKGNPSGATRR